MQRCIEPEWLDHLAPADPRALRARRDLRRLNAVMRNTAVVARALSRVVTAPPRCLVDLGAGDGAATVALARALPAAWRGTRVVLLDRQETVASGMLGRLAARGWHPETVTAEAGEWLAHANDVAPDVIVANLFLHHFDSGPLSALLARIAARARVFVACEPRRSASALGASRLVGVVGCGAVTRHDAVASVRAGFAGRELSALWPDPQGWRLEERACGWFGHLFMAARTDAA